MESVSDHSPFFFGLTDMNTDWLKFTKVRDNGCGIARGNLKFMGKRYHTSKLEDFESFESLESYGFRGEAIHSLCSTAEVTLTTRTSDDDHATTIKFDSSGEVVEESVSSALQGTTISVECK
eukprot:TRINITY_DN4857_c0_g1_i2.p1 TRINITY_DN4857_c0_g1~~TRINITY_DN4857_c0_g1_i2.p1  ORF type:complete len:122 (-),score=25.95 TRINITY_DN4857_c0_g1_i2:511-876(-)